MKLNLNCLLLKDELGRGRLSARDLPPSEHTFGQKSKLDSTGVKGRKYCCSPMIYYIYQCCLMCAISYFSHEHMVNVHFEETIGPERQRLQVAKQACNPQQGYNGKLLTSLPSNPRQFAPLRSTILASDAPKVKRASANVTNLVLDDPAKARKHM